MEPIEVVGGLLVIVGMAIIAYAAFLVHPAVGSIVLGLELILYGSALVEKSRN